MHLRMIKRNVICWNVICSGSAWVGCAIKRDLLGAEPQVSCGPSQGTVEGEVRGAESVKWCLGAGVKSTFLKKGFVVAAVCLNDCWAVQMRDTFHEDR